MSTEKGLGVKVWALLIAVLMLGSAFGGFKYAEATLPTQDGTWGEWFRETYGWFSTMLHLDYATAGRLLATNSGKNVTSTSIGIGTGDDLTGVDWVNATSGSYGDLYVNSPYFVGFTAGRIPIVGAGGLIGSDADLTFVGGDTLTVANVSATSAYLTDLHVSGAWYNGATVVSDLIDYPESEADYIVWVDGATYYAKNGHTGQIDFSGADAATVIQAAINALTSGKIYIKPGIYYLLAPILINKDNISIEGAGGGTAQIAGRINAGATILRSDIAIDLIQITGTGFATNMVVGVNISNLRLRGNGTTNGKDGIWLQYVDLSIIQNVFIDNCDWGIRYQNVWMNEIKGGSIVNCNRGVSVYGSSTEINIIGADISICGTGIYLEGHAMGTIMGNNIVQNDYGVYLLDCAYANRIIGNNIAGGNYGIYLTSSGGGATYGTIINGNAIFDQYMNGITLYKNSHESIITNNNIWDCDRGNTGTYDGIIIGENAACNRNIIQSNQFSDNDRYDVNIVNGTSNGVKNNYFGVGHVNGVSDTGTDTIIQFNQGFITESSDTATILNATTLIVINHGLSYTPTTANTAWSITPLELSTNDPGQFYIDTLTATQATIHCRNDPGASNLDLLWSATKSP